MSVHQRIILALMPLVFTGHSSTAFARGGLSNVDPPWNTDTLIVCPKQSEKRSCDYAQSGRAPPIISRHTPKTQD
jgi:hypothetical protein